MFIIAACVLFTILAEIAIWMFGQKFLFDRANTSKTTAQKAVFYSFFAMYSFAFGMGILILYAFISVLVQRIILA